MRRFFWALKHMLILLNKKTLQFYGQNFCLYWRIMLVHNQYSHCEVSSFSIMLIRACNDIVVISWNIYWHETRAMLLLTTYCANLPSVYIGRKEQKILSAQLDIFKLRKEAKIRNWYIKHHTWPGIPMGRLLWPLSDLSRCSDVVDSLLIAACSHSLWGVCVRSFVLCTLRKGHRTLTVTRQQEDSYSKATSSFFLSSFFLSKMIEKTLKR